MAKKYLNDTGLRYLWNKMKTYINDKISQEVFYWDGLSSTDNPNNIELFQKIYDLYNGNRKFVLICNFYDTLYIPSVILSSVEGLKVKFTKTEFTDNSSGTSTPIVTYTAFTAETNITVNNGTVTNVETFTPIHDSYGTMITQVKTINGESILGSGDISVEGGGTTEKNIMTAYIDGSQKVTASADSYGVVALDNYVKSGSKLTFNATTHQIEIGAGVSKIRVSGQIRFNNAWNAGSVGSAIYKNEAAETVTMGYKYNTSTALGIVNASRIIEVTEGDVIDLRYYTSVSISSKTLGTKNGTYITVEVIETGNETTDDGSNNGPSSGGVND